MKNTLSSSNRHGAAIITSFTLLSQLGSADKFVLYISKCAINFTPLHSHSMESVMVALAFAPELVVPKLSLSDRILRLLRRVDVRRADSAEEREAIFRLRYQAYRR